MLYDPKWEQPKPDIFALDTLIGWLEQQPVDGVYNYSNPNSCLLAQYFKAKTGFTVIVSREYVTVYPERDGYVTELFYGLPKGWNKIAVGTFHDHPWTYKAALRRAKRLRLRLRTKVAVGSTWSRIPQLLGLA